MKIHTIEPIGIAVLNSRIDGYNENLRRSMASDRSPGSKNLKSIFTAVSASRESSIDSYKRYERVKPLSIVMGSSYGA